jgi:hypothetical protein
MNTVVHSCYTVDNCNRISLFEKINVFEVTVSSLIKESLLRKHSNSWNDTVKVFEFTVYCDENNKVYKTAVTSRDDSFVILVPFELRKDKRYMVKYNLYIKMDKRTLTSTEGHFFINERMIFEFNESNLSLTIEAAAAAQHDAGADSDEEEDDEEEEEEGEEEDDVKKGAEVVVEESTEGVDVDVVEGAGGVNGTDEEGDLE